MQLASAVAERGEALRVPRMSFESHVEGSTVPVSGRAQRPQRLSTPAVVAAAAGHRDAGATVGDPVPPGATAAPPVMAGTPSGGAAAPGATSATQVHAHDMLATAADGASDPAVDAATAAPIPVAAAPPIVAASSINPAVAPAAAPEAAAGLALDDGVDHAPGATVDAAASSVDPAPVAASQHGAALPPAAAVQASVRSLIAWPPVTGRVRVAGRTCAQTRDALERARDRDGAPLRYYATVADHPHSLSDTREVVPITGWVCSACVYAPLLYSCHARRAWLACFVRFACIVFPCAALVAAVCRTSTTWRSQRLASPTWSFCSGPRAVESLAS